MSGQASVQSLVDFACVQLAKAGSAGQSWQLFTCGPPPLTVDFSAEAWADAKFAEQTVESLNGAMLEVRAA